MKKTKEQNKGMGLLNIPQPQLNKKNPMDIQRESVSVQLSESDPHYRKSNKKMKSIKSLKEEEGYGRPLAILKQKLASLMADHQNLADEIYIHFGNFSYIIDLVLQQICEKIKQEVDKFAKIKQQFQKFYSSKLDQAEKKIILNKKAYEQRIKQLQNQNTVLKSKLSAIIKASRGKYNKETKQIDNTQDTNEAYGLNDNLSLSTKNEREFSKQRCLCRSEKLLIRDQIWNDKMQSINNIKSVIAKIKDKLHEPKEPQNTNP